MIDLKDFIDCKEIWPMITAIGTIFIAFGIPITLRIAVLNWRKSEANKKENYLLNRSSLSIGILSELNSNENLLKHLLDCEILAPGDVGVFIQSPKTVNLMLNHESISQMYINSFDDASYNYFRKSGISYKEVGIVFELTYIYNKIKFIKTLIIIIHGKIDKEKSIFIAGDISYVKSTLKQIKVEIEIALSSIINVYDMFKNEINFDFINDKEHYRKAEVFVLK